MKLTHIFRNAVMLFALAVALQIAQAQTAGNLKQHISFLASDTLHGRATGTPDEERAANYIIETFKKAGIPNADGKFGAEKYIQHFSYDPIVDSVKTHVSGNNVVAFIDNHAANTIVIGAHYDHLGVSSSGK